jgi:predicted aspartyl protease
MTARAYDGANYDPPAPVLDVFLAPAGDPLTRVWTVALVDTGADISVIGPGIAARLGLPLVGRIQVAGVNDEPEIVPLWRITFDTIFAGRFDVDAIELGRTTIIGRDILNRLLLHFDGPKKMLGI